MSRAYDALLCVACILILAFSPGYVKVMAGGLWLVWLFDQACGRPP